MEEAEKKRLRDQLDKLLKLTCDSCDMSGHVSSACWIRAALKDRSVEPEVRVLWKHFEQAKLKKKREQKAEEKKAELASKIAIRVAAKMKVDEAKQDEAKQLRALEKKK